MATCAVCPKLTRVKGSMDFTLCEAHDAEARRAILDGQAEDFTSWIEAKS